MGLSPIYNWKNKCSKPPTSQPYFCDTSQSQARRLPAKFPWSSARSQGPSRSPRSVAHSPATLTLGRDTRTWKANVKYQENIGKHRKTVEHRKTLWKIPGKHRKTLWKQLKYNFIIIPFKRWNFQVVQVVPKWLDKRPGFVGVLMDSTSWGITAQQISLSWRSECAVCLTNNDIINLHM
jgi:hypothetical protein